MGRRRDIVRQRSEENVPVNQSNPVPPVSPKALRESLGLSRQDAAVMSGLSPEYVRTIESVEQARSRLIEALRV